MYDDEEWMPVRAPLILGLPEELLVGILQLAAFDTLTPECFCACETTYEYRSVKPLALVCHAFNRIATPFLYRHLRLKHPQRMVPPTSAAKTLYRTLRKNPSLGQHCRAIWIEVYDWQPKIKADDFFVATGIVSWLTRVRCLKLRGGFDKQHIEHTWSFIGSVVAHMREIDHLSIATRFLGLTLKPVMEHIHLPSLRKLQIDGVSEANVVLEPKKHRSSPITSLSLSEYHGSGQALTQFLKWPLALFHFRFQGLYNNHVYLDLPMFYSMLLIHKDSLKTIEIGNLTIHGRGRLFQASDFPNLEVLRLSPRQMAQELTSPVADADVLLAPKLKTFGWVFRHDSNDSWSDFGDREEQWLRGFARRAIESKATLNKIEISFGPTVWSATEAEGYPWDRMDRVRDEIRPDGITLEYSQPPVTREGWLKIIDAANEFNYDAYGFDSCGDDWFRDRRLSTTTGDGPSDTIGDGSSDESNDEISDDSEGTEDSSRSDVLQLTHTDPRFHGRDIRKYFFPVEKGRAGVARGQQ